MSFGTTLEISQAHQAASKRRKAAAPSALSKEQNAWKKYSERVPSALTNSFWRNERAWNGKAICHSVDVKTSTGRTLTCSTAGEIARRHPPKEFPNSRSDISMCECFTVKIRQCFFFHFPPSAAQTCTDTHRLVPFCVCAPPSDKLKPINIVTHRSSVMKWLCLASCDFCGPLSSRSHIVWGVERSLANHEWPTTFQTRPRF